MRTSEIWASGNAPGYWRRLASTLSNAQMHLYRAETRQIPSIINQSWAAGLWSPTAVDERYEGGVAILEHRGATRILPLQTSANQPCACKAHANHADPTKKPRTRSNLNHDTGSMVVVEPLQMG